MRDVLLLKCVVSTGLAQLDFLHVTSSSPDGHRPRRGRRRRRRIHSAVSAVVASLVGVAMRLLTGRNGLLLLLLLLLSSFLTDQRYEVREGVVVTVGVRRALGIFGRAVSAAHVSLMMVAFVVMCGLVGRIGVIRGRRQSCVLR